MKYWNTYKLLINRNCSSPAGNLKDLSFWRDNLFAGILIYILPFSFITLLPSLYMTIVTGRHILAFADILIITIIAVVAFIGGLRLSARKIIFISCVYTLSCTLLYFLGLHGPGLIYLLVACMISLFIFNAKHTFWPVWLNLVICSCFGTAKYLDVLPWPNDRDNALAAWVALSSSLVFLSLLMATLLARVFNGLQETIIKENKLKDELAGQQQSLQNTLHLLEQKNDELEQFAYVISHDLKEPVRMVSSFMGLLKRNYGNQLDKKAHTYIDFAIEGGIRMQNMIGDLLELSRTSPQHVIKEMVNLNDSLNEAKQNIFSLIEESQAEITVLTQLPILPAYKVDIIRLLQNILSNAIKFRKKETYPMIRLNATEKADQWLFSIEDNGIGIENDKFEKIFEIFSRLHTHTDYDGTGIGLSVCKKVVEHHGGRIWLESEEGKGSSFYFTINK